MELKKKLRGLQVIEKAEGSFLAKGHRVPHSSYHRISTQSTYLQIPKLFKIPLNVSCACPGVPVLFQLTR